MTDTAAFVRSTNAFGLDLWQRLPSSGNQAFSPTSVTTALAMMVDGAMGETADQLRQVMRLEGPTARAIESAGQLCATLTDARQPFTIRIANRLFGEATFVFEALFLAAGKAAFGAPLEAVRFQKEPELARRRINACMAALTDDRVRDLIPSGSITKDTRLVAANAIYFIGNWTHPFTKEATKPAYFHISPIEKKVVLTMHTSATVRYTRDDGLAVLELPYVGHALSMLLVLPDALDGLPAVEGRLTLGALDGIVSSLARTPVFVRLPKFEVDPVASYALKPLLQPMGLSSAFDRERADFTGIANPTDPDERLFVSDVFHKAFVRVDEKGTEAAAATAIQTDMIGSARRIEFRADHPFLFLIRDNTTGALLFMGRVADPVAPQA